MTVRSGSVAVIVAENLPRAANGQKQSLHCRPMVTAPVSLMPAGQRMVYG